MAADANYSDVVLLLPMSGANNGTVFTDYSPSPKTVTVGGNAKTVTVESEYYGSSGYFDGSGDYLLLEDGDHFDFGAGHFTIESRVRFATFSSAQPILTRYGGATGYPGHDKAGFLFMVSNSTTIRFDFRDGVDKSTYRPVVFTVPTLSTGTLYYLALSRSGSNWYLFIDGTQVGGTQTQSASINYAPDPDPLVGRFYVTSPTDANFYLNDLRITKGVARYTENFTPPGKLIGSISGTVYNAAGNPAQRTVIAVPRSYPNTRNFITQSSAVDGTYSLTVPDMEYSRIVLADETTLYNDIVDRVLPG